MYVSLYQVPKPSTGLGRGSHLRGRPPGLLRVIEREVEGEEEERKRKRGGGREREIKGGGESESERLRESSTLLCSVFGCTYVGAQTEHRAWPRLPPSRPPARQEDAEAQAAAAANVRRRAAARAGGAHTQEQTAG